MQGTKYFAENCKSEVKKQERKKPEQPEKTRNKDNLAERTRWVTHTGRQDTGETNRSSTKAGKRTKKGSNTDSTGEEETFKIKQEVYNSFYLWPIDCIILPLVFMTLCEHTYY